MLTRIIESALVNTYNRARRLRQTRAAKLAAVPDGHVVLGKALAPLPYSQSEPVSLSAEERRRHMYLLGATGSGKTNLLLRLIESDIANDHSFCVIDLRGDLIDRILLRLAAAKSPALADRLLLIDLRDTDNIVGFNPLVGAGDPYSRAYHVMSVLKYQSDSWGIQLEETLRNCLIALAESGWSLLEIEPLLADAGFRAEVMASVSDSYVQSFFARYGELSKDKQVTWRLPVLNKVTPLLAIPQLRLMFGQRTSFSFSDLLDSEPGRIILVSLAVDRLHSAAYLVGGLFISAFQSAIMARARMPEEQRIPCFLYVDEFETMASEDFAAIVAEGRRFGLGLCLSHQNGLQIPTELRHVLRNNVHTQLYFQTGALDAADLATEIITSDPRDTVRTTLLTQAVGEAYLIRRGQESIRIRTEKCPDPAAGPEALRAIRAQSISSYSRLRAEIEAELAERRSPTQWDSQEERVAETPLEASSQVAVRSKKPTFEIRHGKTANFKPKES